MKKKKIGHYCKICGLPTGRHGTTICIFCAKHQSDQEKIYVDPDYKLVVGANYQHYMDLAGVISEINLAIKTWRESEQ